MSTDADALAIAGWLRAARSVVVLTGAGMSAESGIPTFRDAHTGLWSRFDPRELATPAAWRKDAALVWGWYLWRMARVRATQPHAGHDALARMARLHFDFALVTQNVDDLHERAGNANVVHLHGSLFASRCVACGHPAGAIAIPADAVDAPSLRVEPPRCKQCGGAIRPGVVWFGETLSEDTWRRAVDATRHCDVLLAVGTSGVVHPAASLPGIARSRGAKVAEINPVATDLSETMNRVWRTTAGHALPEIISALARDRDG